MESISAWLETVEFYSFCLIVSVTVENYFHSNQAPREFQLQAQSQLHERGQFLAGGVFS